MTETIPDQPGLAPRQQVWRRFRRHKLALFGFVVLLVLGIAALFAPYLVSHDPYKIGLGKQYRPPSREYLLGTDSIGRDNLSRLIYGARISLSVGLVSVSLSASLGVIMGVTAGYHGGRLDTVLSRLADLFMSFPDLIIILTLVSVLGPNIVNVMLVIGVLSWPQFFRLVRGECLSVKQRDFVEASRAIGGPVRRILTRHILPNTVAPLIVLGTLRVATAILTESTLSFLGLGVRPPAASWGNMLTDAQSLTVLSQRPWVWVPPGLMISLAVLSINFLGDGLRDALDPRATYLTKAK
jgi:peptide/nickel transport system permease protein